jgi:hypothetical protein
MGGPRLCLGGRSPMPYRIHGTKPRVILCWSSVTVNHLLIEVFFLYPLGYFSYGGPQALPGGAKPDSSGVEGIDSSFAS